MAKLYKRGKVYWADLRQLGGGRVTTGCTTIESARIRLGKLEVLAVERMAASSRLERSGLSGLPGLEMLEAMVRRVVREELARALVATTGKG